MTLQHFESFSCGENLEATLFCFHSENKPAIIFHLRFYGLHGVSGSGLGNSAVSHMDDEFFSVFSTIIKK